MSVLNKISTSINGFYLTYESKKNCSYIVTDIHLEPKYYPIIKYPVEYVANDNNVDVELLKFEYFK